MRIREAIAADIPALVSIGRRTWPEAYAFAGPDYIEDGLRRWWSPAAVAQSLADTTVLVAASGDDLVGVGNLDRRGPVPIIWKLYVLPSAQGTGAGSALIEALIALAGDRPVRLEYADGNTRAARFYAARGFAEIGREPGERPGWPGTVWLEHPAT